MRLSHFVPVILIILSSCYQVCTTDGMSDNENCLRGRAILFSCCTGTTIFEMDASTPIGKEITIGNVTYHNAIQIVGSFEGELSLTLRKFDWEKDQDKIAPVCYCFTIESWASLPAYVVKSSSATDCSSNE